MQDKLDNTDSTMAADNIFNHILETIQKSSLNYHLQISPFSAIIQLKKSLVKDRFGNPVMPTCAKQDHLVEKLNTLRNKYEALLCEHSMSKEIIAVQRDKLKDREKTIENLVMSNSIAIKTAELLSAKTINNRIRFEMDNIFQEQIQSDIRVSTVHVKEESSLEVQDTHNSVTNYPDLNGSQIPTVDCTPCGAENYWYPQNDLHGKVVHAPWQSCKSRDLTVNPYLTFEDIGSSSLLSHWIPYSSCHSAPDISITTSFRSHYVNIHKNNDEFDWMIEMLKNLDAMMEKQERMLDDRCNTS